MITKDTASYKASEFIYDLGNTALENGFKPDENWEIQIATADEKKGFEKHYHPIVSTKVPPDLLNATLTLVKAHLSQATKINVHALPDRFAKEPEYQYLVAYNANRIRR
jgi:hypothetical protein